MPQATGYITVHSVYIDGERMEVITPIIPNFQENTLMAYSFMGDKEVLAVCHQKPGQTDIEFAMAMEEAARRMHGVRRAIKRQFNSSEKDD